MSLHDIYGCISATILCILQNQFICTVREKWKLLFRRMLLEKRDTATTECRSVSLRIASGGFIIMSVVLTKIPTSTTWLLPGCHCHNETVSELIWDEFTIFTKIRNMDNKTNQYRSNGLDMILFLHEIHDSNFQVIIAGPGVADLTFIIWYSNFLWVIFVVFCGYLRICF